MFPVILVEFFALGAVSRIMLYTDIIVNDIVTVDYDQRTGFEGHSYRHICGFITLHATSSQLHLRSAIIFL